MSYPVIHIANKIIASTNIEQGDLISNLKLQKLLYYVQGFNIAIFDEKLFEEEIEAWQYGPVIRSVYDEFKTFGSKAIVLKKDDKIAQLTDEQESLFKEVIEEYGQYNAIKLMKMTHKESPWAETFSANPQGVISYKLVSDYFKTQIVA